MLECAIQEDTGQRLERFCETNPICPVRQLGLNSHYRWIEGGEGGPVLDDG